MTSSAPPPGGPDTVVLIHGLWMTPLSWEHWVERYGARGYAVVTPAWPRMDVPIEDLRRDMSAVAGLGVIEVVDHYDKIIRGLDSPPIIMGHSYGGLFTQILLDRGLGAAGVSLAPAPVKGVLRLPASTLRVAFPALRNPANVRKAMPLTAEQFRYAFGNTLSEEESLAAYHRYAVPGPDRVLFQAGLANLTPHAATKVDFGKADRAPLLLIAGGKDHISPPAPIKEAAGHYRKSPAATEYKEYPDRSHFTVGEPGWEEVADYALDWAAAQAAGRTTPAG